MLKRILWSIYFQSLIIFFYFCMNLGWSQFPLGMLFYLLRFLPETANIWKDYRFVQRICCNFIFIFYLFVIGACETSLIGSLKPYFLRLEVFEIHVYLEIQKDFELEGIKTLQYEFPEQSWMLAQCDLQIENKKTLTVSCLSSLILGMGQLLSSTRG